MKNKIIYALVIFSLGYITNDIVGDLIRPAQAFEVSSFDIDDFESRVENIIDSHNFSSDDIDNFQSAVENVVEYCTADEDGNISC